MKSNLFCTLTVGVFLVCALYTVWLSVRMFFTFRELQQLQYQYVGVEQLQQAAQGLANEAVEFGKTNAAIDGILQRFDLKPKAGSTNAPAPRSAKAPAQ